MKKINKKLFIILFTFISLFLCLFSVNNKVYAGDVDCGKNCEIKASTLSDNDLNTMFELKIQKALSGTGAINWFTTYNTYVAVQKNGDGSKYIWWNVPNTQQWIVNKVLAIFPTGFSGSGMKPLSDNPKNAVEKWGFDLPNITYLGEQPYITMDLTKTIIPQNPGGWLRRLIKFIFKGDVMEPPNKDTMKTLHYTNVKDYYPDPNTLENWIKNNWKDVIGGMNAGQCLHGGGSKDNKCTVDGQTYVKDTIITQPGLDDWSKIDPNRDAQKIIRELQNALGSEYEEVITNILAYGKSHGAKENDNSSYIRIMPYDIKTMTEKDYKALSIPDPRAEYQKDDIPFGAVGRILNFIPLGIFSRIKNFLNDKIIGIGAFFSEKTVWLSTLVNLDILDEWHLSPIDLWKTPIATILIYVIVIYTVFKLGISAIRLAAGKGSLGKIIIDFFLMFMIIGVFVAIQINPDKVWGSVKSVSSTIFNWGENSLTLNEDLKPFYGTGSASDNVKVTYWLPYFGLWSEYNVGYNTLASPNKITDDTSGQPEQKGKNSRWFLPKVNNDSGEIKFWSAALLDSMDNGTAVDNSAYRVVDHFMAPRATINWDSNPKVTVKANENYNGQFQKSADFGILLLIILLFVCMLWKVMLFLNAWFEMYSFIANVAIVAITPRDMWDEARKLGMAILFVGLWGIYISLIVIVSLSIDGAGGTALALFLWWATLKLLKWWSNLGEGSKPRLLGKIMDMLNWMKTGEGE